MRWHTPRGIIELAPLQNTPDRNVPVSVLLQEATNHFNNNRLQEAGSLCQTILRSLPNNADALHLLGVINYQAGRYQLAIEYIKKAIVIDPSKAHYHNNIGEAYRGLGFIEEATQSYLTALQLQPEFDVAHNNLANVLAAVGKNDEAAYHYANAIRLKPDYAEAYRNLSLISDLKPDDEMTCAIQSLLDKPGLPESDAMHLRFA